MTYVYMEFHISELWLCNSKYEKWSSHLELGKNGIRNYDRAIALHMLSYQAFSAMITSLKIYLIHNKRCCHHGSYLMVVRNIIPVVVINNTQTERARSKRQQDGYSNENAIPKYNLALSQVFRGYSVLFTLCNTGELSCNWMGTNGF